MKNFSHYDSSSAKMVDVSGKEKTARSARACCFVRLGDTSLDMIENQLVPKGEPFEVARIAGIMAAKKTSELIPLCHQLNLNFVDVAISINKNAGGIDIESVVRLQGTTGAEMEALTAVSIAALTLYDMCKSVDDNIIIEKAHLIEKKGGKSSFFQEK